MSGAKFDIDRRRLGLSIGEAASVCGVTERTINRWIRDEQPILDYAWGRIALIELTMGDTVEMAARMACDATDAGPFKIPHYRNEAALREAMPDNDLPFGAHSMMTAWLAEALEDEGIIVEIVWSD